jgi:hypothetical protein
MFQEVLPCGKGCFCPFSRSYDYPLFQFFGTVFQYRDENPSKRVRAIFYTSTQLSDLASRFAKALEIELVEIFH